MFDWLGRLIARRPALCVAAWAVVLVTATIWARVAPPVRPAEVGSFLPPGSPHNISSDIIKEAFPEIWSNSMVVLVGHRAEGVRPGDLLWLDAAARATRDAAKEIVSGSAVAGGTALRVNYLSPVLPFLRERLISRDGQAALALVNLPTNFISEGTIRAVDAAEEIIGRDRPAGLTVEVTGPAGIGHDYFLATQRAVHRTTWVTIVAVLLILVVVYRSPIGALVPLVSIGASVYVAFVLLGVLSRFGWDVSAMERIFCVVLMFGAGVDYALFWIARYRESLTAAEAESSVGITEEVAAGRAESVRIPRGWNHRSIAALTATRETGPAILASAGTTICGLTTMLAADLVPSRNAGRVLAVAITVALAASLTLAPALARWLGRYLFWPMGVQGRAGLGQRFTWPWLARQVTRRPRPVLVAGTGALAVLSAWAFLFPPRFDALQELPPDTSSSRGLELANAHFSRGELYPNCVLAVYEAAKAPADLSQASRAISEAIAGQPGVNEVFSLSRPLGKSSAGSAVPAALMSMMTRALYQGQTRSGQTVLRFEVLLDDLPFSPEAIGTFERVSAAARAAAAEARPEAAPRVLLSGLTSYILGVKKVVGADQQRVMILATLVIFLIVLAMVRDLALSVFMILSTWLTYGATITLSNLFLIHVMGLSGLDWKVRLILFVIVVAVGQDYNIFLVSRLVTRRNGAGGEESVREAVVRTGSVISSCGIIMAATLGSLWAGGLSLLRQLGFALALGILIDTFFVRPLLIPSFYLVLGRWRKRRRRGVLDGAHSGVREELESMGLDGTGCR